MPKLSRQPLILFRSLYRRRRGSVTASRPETTSIRAQNPKTPHSRGRCSLIQVSIPIAARKRLGRNKVRANRIAKTIKVFQLGLNHARIALSHSNIVAATYQAMEVGAICGPNCGFMREPLTQIRTLPGSGGRRVALRRARSLRRC